MMPGAGAGCDLDLDRRLSPAEVGERLQRASRHALPTPQHDVLLADGVAVQGGGCIAGNIYAVYARVDRVGIYFSCD